MSTLKLFGAGASAYCGKGSVHPSFPPLGNNLYNSLSKMDGMEELQNVSTKIRGLFEKDFEKGFGKFLLAKNDPNESPIRFMCGLAYYFTQV